MATTSTITRQFDCAVIGGWHLAHCVAACLAHTGRKVALVNPLLGEEPEWARYPEPPVREPGLPEMIQNAQSSGHLGFVNGVSAEWSAEIVWLAIDTPVNENDEPDVSGLEEMARRVRRHGVCRGVFAMNSQVPLGFSSRLEKELALPVAYVPENLRLGKGIDTFLKADRTVIGASKPETAEVVRSLMSGFSTEFLLCDLATAEMIKHATNIFLATSISFANELARVGEKLHVDSSLVAKALKLDKRIGPAAYVEPGLGFYGGTLPRDLRILQKLGKNEHVPTPLVEAVLQVNASTSAAISESVLDYLQVGQGSARNLSVLILGYTYKAETDTLRRSPSVELAEFLSSRGVQIYGFDPPMNEKDLKPIEKWVRHLRSIEELPQCPDAIVLMTARELFKELNWAQIAAKKRPRSGSRPPFVLDARGMIRQGEVVNAGFAYKKMWQPVELPPR